MRWFMSYAYSLKAFPDEQHFGCCISKDEHPVVKVTRWNETLTDRTTVLIYFQAVGDEVPVDGSRRDFET